MVDGVAWLLEAGAERAGAEAARAAQQLGGGARRRGGGADGVVAGACADHGAAAGGGGVVRARSARPFVALVPGVPRRGRQRGAAAGHLPGRLAVVRRLHAAAVVAVVCRTR